MSVDSADETITATNQDGYALKNMKDVAIINGTDYVTIDNNSGVAVSDGKIYTEKPRYKTITMTGKPSCTRCARHGVPYKWFTRTYKNYCPNCHHYNCLGNKHKRGAVYEKEITCFHCDSDFCVYCGKEKYSWSRAYLQK